MKKLCIYLACLGLFAIAGASASGQAKPTPKQAQEANLKAYIDLLRQDVKKGKVSILTDLMDLTPEEAAKFWPVYKEYDAALTKLKDERLAFIRMYADNYRSLSDDMAAKIATGLMDVEAKRVELCKQYFGRFSQTLTAKDAARWLQIEAQLERVIDLQILASLPIAE